MSTKVGLFVRHQAKPGKRDEIQRVWKQFVQPHVQSNQAHEAYYFCFDNNDPDVVCAFQVFKDKDSLDTFLASDWYPDYLNQVGECIAEPPLLTETSVVWDKWFS